ncbi:CsxC family protein [Paenibacillus apiarius]|uniref:CsxC family protein n=1 Tax=Paenibacillus apiarius TaxID=46240 RepID=UPI003B3BE192
MSCDDRDCRVVESTTLAECDNEKHDPHWPTIKVPLVLAEREVQVNVEALISLDEPALEIKRIKKKVFLEQCKLVPTDFHGKWVTRAKLYLRGFIRKNIEYATADRSPTDTAVCGRILHTTAHVPFQCVTEIKFGKVKPELISERVEEFEFLGKDEMSPRLDKTLFSHDVFFNEQPFCELVKVRFHELDLGEDFDYDDDLPRREKTFRKLREKIVVHVTVKVLQKQQVPLPLGHKDDDDDCKDHKDHKDHDDHKDYRKDYGKDYKKDYK